MPRTKNVAIINVAKTKSILHERILSAVNSVATDAYDHARSVVPVRKVFRYGRTRAGLRVQGRQELRTQSLEEALAESLVRRRLGLPSAFPTTASGRRRPGSQPLVRTAQLTGTYRSQSRSNPADLSRREIGRINGENRIVSREDIHDDRGRIIGQRLVARPDIEADLSSRGRAELARASVKGGEKSSTLGGALRGSIRLQRAEDGRRMTALITAGSDEVDYAKYVEFGTRRSRAQPFMRPAKALAREELPDAVRRSLSGAGTSGKRR